MPKTLLFENFNISDLSHYFVNKHEDLLIERFAKNKPSTSTTAKAAKKAIKPVEVVSKNLKKKLPSTIHQSSILILPENLFQTLPF